MSTPNDPLDPLLDRWSEVPPPSARLNQEVWRRIAVEETCREPSGVFARIEAWFASPAFTTVFVISCMLLGLFLAEMRVVRVQSQRNVQLAQSYLRLIDPLLQEQASAPAPGFRP